MRCEIKLHVYGDMAPSPPRSELGHTKTKQNKTPTPTKQKKPERTTTTKTRTEQDYVYKNVHLLSFLSGV